MAGRFARIDGMTTRVVGADAGGVAAAVEVLRGGGCVGLPTETVYGLGAAGLDPVACAGIFEAKGRPLTDPLILHVPDVGWLDRLAIGDNLARRLAEAFWPGPLTLVVPRRGIVPDIVTAGQETVALRMSAHPVMAAVLAEFGAPLAAPSANRFGRISPTSSADVVAELGGRIPLVVDGGQCAHGIESTIVLVEDERLVVLRPGPISVRDLTKFAPMGRILRRPVVPGSLESHYSPRTRLEIVDEIPEWGAGDVAALLFKKRIVSGYRAVEVLSESGDPREAAANLYGAMRRLDASGAGRIVVGAVPERGIGVAVMDRLRRASAKSGERR
jgi:L-threonylcarbamoyladenylate synthase